MIHQVLTSSKELEKSLPPPYQGPQRAHYSGYIYFKRLIIKVMDTSMLKLEIDDCCSMENLGDGDSL